MPVKVTFHNGVEILLKHFASEKHLKLFTSDQQKQTFLSLYISFEKLI